MDIFLEVKYFINIDFTELINDFKNINKEYHIFEGTDKNNKSENYSLNNKDLKRKTSNTQNQIDVRKNNYEKNNSEIKKSMDNGEDKNDVIFLSRHNTFIVSDKSFDKLMEKVEALKNKTFIKNEKSIERNNQVSNY